MPAFSYLYSIPYLIIFCLLLINSIPLIDKSNCNVIDYNKVITFQKIFVITILIIFLGFRGYIMIDWINYSKFYAASPTLFDNHNLIKNMIKSGMMNGIIIERGFLVYMMICKTISSNYLFFQFISFIVDLIILYQFFKREIPEYIIMGFVFFLIFYGIQLEMHILRNAKAMLLFLISIKYIKEKSFYNFFLLNCIGALFHISSLFYIPLYFIINKTIPRSLLLILFVIGNFIYLLRVEWLKSILSHISLPGRIGYLIKTYLVSERYSVFATIGIGYIERSFTFLLVFFLSKKIISIDKNDNIYINTIYLYCYIYLYFSEMYIFIERVVNLFVFSYWIIYPKIYSLISKQIKYAFILLLFIYGNLKLARNNNRIYYLYDNILLSYRSSQEREYNYKQNQLKIFNKGNTN